MKQRLVPLIAVVALIAALTLVLLLAAISHGFSTQNRGALWLGYIGFSIEILHHPENSPTP